MQQSLPSVHASSALPQTVVVSQPLADFIASRRIEGKLHEDLMHFVHEACVEMNEIVERLSPSANTLRGIMQLAGEIAHRDSLSLSTVLRAALESAFQNKSEAGNRKESQKKLREHLERCRYPEVIHIHDRLSHHVGVIASELGLRITLPKDLEGSDVSIQLSLESRQEAEDASKSLMQLAEHESFDSILSILRGKEC